MNISGRTKKGKKKAPTRDIGKVTKVGKPKEEEPKKYSFMERLKIAFSVLKGDHALLSR